MIGGWAEAGTLNRRDRMYLAGPLSDRGQDGADGKVVQEGTGRKSRVCFMLKMTQFLIWLLMQVVRPLFKIPNRRDYRFGKNIK